MAVAAAAAAFCRRREEAGEPLPEREVWAYVLQLALALAALHRRRVLHRDIKPQVRPLCGTMLWGHALIHALSNKKLPQVRQGWAGRGERGLRRASGARE